MPHITVQLYSGRDEATKRALALAVRDAAAQSLGREKEHFSVSVVDVPQQEWKERVYDQVTHDPNTIIQPGYTM